VGDTPASDLHSFTVETLQALPQVDGHPFQSPIKKNESLRNYIAQDFIAIVTLASSDVEKALFEHYCPYYNLHRAKEYFLLI